MSAQRSGRGKANARIGENGAGKSALLKILADDQQVESGEVNVQAFYQIVATGVVIIVAMLIDRATRG